MRGNAVIRTTGQHIILHFPLYVILKLSENGGTSSLSSFPISASSSSINPSISLLASIDFFLTMLDKNNTTMPPKTTPQTTKKP
mmetsp:Transcript_21729/g.39187  ORF Transcript_21729/g.39187 Transcript_21729/m.39187 type:complete len:84 (-) Transcript_21729:256-507(-)